MMAHPDAWGFPDISRVVAANPGEPVNPFHGWCLGFDCHVVWFVQRPEEPVRAFLCSPCPYALCLYTHYIPYPILIIKALSCRVQSIGCKGLRFLRLCVTGAVAPREVEKRTSQDFDWGISQYVCLSG